MNKTVLQIQNLIAQGNGKEAIDVLVKLSKGNQFHSSAILISNRYNNLEKEKINNTIDRNKWEVANNKIFEATLVIAQRIEYELKGNSVEEHKINNPVAAYENALNSIGEIASGLVKYDQIFYSIESLQKVFPASIRGDIFLWEGHEFYWYKKPNEPLLLKAQYLGTSIEDVCSFNIPENWIGSGIWRIYWPTHMDREETTVGLIIFLLLFSEDPILVEKFDEMKIKEIGGAHFLGALYLGPSNTNVFHRIAEKNYQSLE